jgi:hypothetical protein
MRILTTLGIAVGLAALSACNQSPREEAAENAADAIEANTENAADTLEANAQNAADAVRAEGENRADAVREGADADGNSATNNAY